MTTEPTAFHSIPPKRLVICLKILIFVNLIHHSIIVLQCPISLRICQIFPDFYSLRSKITSCDGYITNLLKILYRCHAQLIITRKTRFSSSGREWFLTFLKMFMYGKKKFMVNLIAFLNKLLNKQVLKYLFMGYKLSNTKEK